jgi:hypothetical protein
VAKSYFPKNFWRSLIAVLVGNGIYGLLELLKRRRRSRRDASE